MARPLSVITYHYCYWYRLLCFSYFRCKLLHDASGCLTRVERAVRFIIIKKYQIYQMYTITSCVFVADLLSASAVGVRCSVKFIYLFN